MFMFLNYYLNNKKKTSVTWTVKKKKKKINTTILNINTNLIIFPFSLFITLSPHMVSSHMVTMVTCYKNMQLSFEKFKLLWNASAEANFSYYIHLAHIFEWFCQSFIYCFPYCFHFFKSIYLFIYFFFQILKVGWS